MTSAARTRRPQLRCERDDTGLVDAGPQPGAELRRARCPLCGLTAVLPGYMVTLRPQPGGGPMTVAWA